MPKGSQRARRSTVRGMAGAERAGWSAGGGAILLVICAVLGGCANYRSSPLDCGAGAPDVDQRAPAAGARLVPGCTVRILTRDGGLLEGRYVGANADSLWLDKGGEVESPGGRETGWSGVDNVEGARKVACRDVVDLQLRQRNTAGSVTVGVLSGLVLLVVVLGNVIGASLGY